MIENVKEGARKKCGAKGNRRMLPGNEASWQDRLAKELV